MTDTNKIQNEIDQDPTAFQAYMNKTFNIVKDSRAMFFGATIMDTNPSAGYDPEIMTQNKKPPHPEWSPYNALTLYPEVESIEESAEDRKKASLAMACCWLNGFIHTQLGMADAANMTRTCKNFLAGRNVVTTDQLLKNRNDSKMIALYNNFSWYGSNGVKITTNGNESFDNLVDDLTLAKNVRQGIVCTLWKTESPMLRYFVKLDPNFDLKDNPDYLYFIGGSADVIGDNLDDVPGNIYNMLHQMKNCIDESKKVKFDDGKYNPGYSSDPHKLWWCYSGDSSHPVIKAHLIAKKILRTIESVFFIRNYFIYAQKNILINEVNEIGWDSKNKKAIFTKVDIQKIINKYDKIYSYCKNLCYINKDIASGNLL